MCGDDIVENAHHPFSCELNQSHLELIPGLLSRLTSLDLMVRPLDEFEHDEVPKEIKILGEHCLNIRHLRGDFLPLIDLKLSRFFSLPVIQKCQFKGNFPLMVIRIESWKVFSPTSMAYLLQKLGGHLEWLELVWIEPIYMMGPILRAERAWPIMRENLRDLAKQRLHTR